MANFKNWERFFENRRSMKLHAGSLQKAPKKGKNNEKEMISVNLRIPSSLRQQIEKDLRVLVDNGRKTSLNDYMLLLITVAGNYGQNEQGEFYQMKTGERLSNYIDSITEKPKRETVTAAE